ncbi:hypothetical protein [Rhizobium oryziradicis]|uniref:hypothetical protein n=1 Tax=Rhizobium oryziradicis TaxID=1867956 RepID=UPI000B3037E9|nr:hypothetical protein [Rhizobium oryziradicis]
MSTPSLVGERLAACVARGLLHVIATGDYHGQLMVAHDSVAQNTKIRRRPG